MVLPTLRTALPLLFLGVTAGRAVRVILPIGVPSEEGPRREKRLFEERAWFNRHG